jgi:hypothetical protein
MPENYKNKTIYLHFRISNDVFLNKKISLLPFFFSAKKNGYLVDILDFASSKDNIKSSNFFHLPKFVFYQILIFLDLNSLNNFSLACRYFYLFASQQELFSEKSKFLPSLQDSFLKVTYEGDNFDDLITNNEKIILERKEKFILRYTQGY